MKDKTTLVIAHRLSTLQMMDRILVFSNGAIVEDGCHEDLLELNGYYKRLWTAQSGGVLTYQIMGPLEQIPVGTKVNKYGQTTPEKYTWLDPRTPELVMRRADGTLTEKGRGLYTFLVGEKGGGVWSLIDRDIVSNLLQLFRTSYCIGSRLKKCCLRSVPFGFP